MCLCVCLCDDERSKTRVGHFCRIRVGGRRSFEKHTAPALMSGKRGMTGQALFENNVIVSL